MGALCGQYREAFLWEMIVKGCCAFYLYPPHDHKAGAVSEAVGFVWPLLEEIPGGSLIRGYHMNHLHNPRVEQRFPHDQGPPVAKPRLCGGYSLVKNITGSNQTPLIILKKLFYPLVIRIARVDIGEPYARINENRFHPQPSTSPRRASGRGPYLTLSGPVLCRQSPAGLRDGTGWAVAAG